jgi:hypothetical protein
VFVANRDSDPMILPRYSHLLTGLIPDARLKIYPDAAHGFLFQHHAEVAPTSRPSWAAHRPRIATAPSNCSTRQPSNRYVNRGAEPIDEAVAGALTNPTKEQAR